MSFYSPSFDLSKSYHISFDNAIFILKINKKYIDNETT